jgi:hypothetical protein
MKRKNQSKSLLLLSSLSLSLVISCTSIREIDKPVCVELNLSKAFCTYTISNKDFFIDDENLYEGKTWFEMRPAMVLVPPETWASFKSYIIKTCKKHPKQCRGLVEGWDRTINVLDQQLEVKGVPLAPALP